MKCPALVRHTSLSLVRPQTLEDSDYLHVGVPCTYFVALNMCTVVGVVD